MTAQPSALAGTAGFAAAGTSTVACAERLDPRSLADHGPVIPVIVVDRLEDAVPLARALVAGGVRVLEVTLRTPAGLPAIEAIARQVPEAIVGAGTVRTVAEAEAAARAGSRFIVSPGCVAAVGQACARLGVAWLPGVATASEVMQTFADGHRFMKFFPAVQAGGVSMLKALAGPFPEVVFCPTGGLTPQTAPDFLALDNVVVCGGSWLTPAATIRSNDWSAITLLAEQTRQLRR